MKKIETKRLILRGFVSSDLNDFYEYAKNPNVGPMAGWKPHDSINESKEILTRMTEGNEVWGLYHKEDSKIIGSIGLHKRSKRPKLELGFVLSEDYWGQGLMPEACESIIKHAFEEIRVHKVEVFHFDYNKQSRRVIEKMGFIYEGTKRDEMKKSDGTYIDSLGYSMLSNEYFDKIKEES